MSTKFIRFVAALAVIISIVGNSGVARADHGAPPSVSAQKIQPPRAPEPQPLDIPALSIPPASSLGVQFVHVATVANSSGNGTIIDHPLTNGNPNAIILVTPNYNPGGVGGTYDNHPIGVFYNTVVGKWVIFDQEWVVPVGAAFNVIIPTAGAGVFVHTATVGNSIGDYTIINNSLTNGNPNAIVFVTPNWNPGGVGGTYNNHPIGVWYDGSKWAIFNQDLTAIPVDAAFNVFVLSTGAGVFVHTATAGNSAGDHTNINNPLTNGNPNALVFVTPNWNPGGVGGTYDNHNIGVFYGTLASKWAIFNQDGGAMPVDVAFNVLVLVPSSDIFVHTATAGNISGNETIIDSALTNGHPNAIVFVTPNWNPDGVGGTYDNHPIGVYYIGGTWSIFNQDASAMPVGAAFNVLVPNPDTSVFVHTATAGNTSTTATIIDNALTNGNPNAIVFVTPNWNPGGICGCEFTTFPIGVYYDALASKWGIFNQNYEAMPVNSAFNVTVPTAGPGVGVFVHTATVANTIENWTVIDYPLTNGNPNAIVVVTTNWNPGGVGGTNDNHPIGVWYDGSKWAIFNQDIAAMPVGTAFNVYVFVNYKLYLPLVIR